MYRIFCESYGNLVRHLSGDDGRETARLSSAKTLALLCDKERFHLEREKDTERYRKVADLLYYLGRNEKEYPRAQAFLWTLDARDIVGCHTGAATEEELEEMARLVVMLLKLMYWDEVG